MARCRGGWVFVLLIIASEATAQHHCYQCLDVRNFLETVENDGGTPCSHISQPYADMCVSISGASDRSCSTMGFCSPEEEFRTWKTDMKSLVGEQSLLDKTVSFLETSSSETMQTGISEDMKFSIKIFWFSIKLLIPHFWMLRYERSLTKANKPKPPPSLLEIDSVVGNGTAFRPSLEPHLLADQVIDRLNTAASFLQTSSNTGTGNFFKFLKIIGHWFLRYTNWFAWIVKWRLLRVRYWVSGKHDHERYLYRPHIAGWGWGAQYDTNFGGGWGGAGGGNDKEEVPDNMDASEFGSGSDETIISSPLDEEEEEVVPPYPIHDKTNERYYPDEINNDVNVTMKLFNYYNIEDPNYYPNPGEEGKYVEPLFGQPIYAPPPEDQQLIQKEASVQALPAVQKLLGKKSKTNYHHNPNLENFTFEELEARAQRALENINKHVLVNNSSSVRVAKPSADPVKPHTNSSQEQLPGSQSIDSSSLVQAPDSVTLKGVVKQDKAIPPTKIRADPYEKLTKYRASGQDDDVVLTSQQDHEFDQGLKEWAEDDRKLQQFVSPNNPVNDRGFDFLEDADQDEQSMANTLTHEYSKMEHNKPMQLDNSANWEHFNDVQMLLHTGAMVANSIPRPPQGYDDPEMDPEFWTIHHED